MNLKKTILSLLSRDALKKLVESAGIEDVDRRSVEEMQSALSRARRVTAEGLLETLSETDVRAVCEQMGVSVSPAGRRAKLIEALLANATGNGANHANDPVQEDESEPGTADPEPPVRRFPEPPPGMLRVTKTELVWPGKYNEDGSPKEVPRVSLPFQVIERVNESRGTREATKKGVTLGLFDTYTGKEGDTLEEGWRNKLIWGDNLLVMSSLLERFAGKVDLIYIDPPFATGADFSFTTEVGDAETTLDKSASAIEEKAYRDTWGRGVDSYLEMLWNRLTLMRDLLSPAGALVVHLDWHVAHHVRHLLDQCFGTENFKNEIIWYYYNRFAADGKNFGRKHDNLFWYSKATGVHYQPIDEDRKEPQKRLLRKKKEGRAVNVRDESGALVYYEQTTRRVDDVWRIPLIPPASSEYVGYPTQKPTELLERLITALVPQAALIADFFSGSGTSLIAAEKLGRRWIGCDLGRYPIHVARKRLLEIEDCKPFEVLNLGKYERKYWSVATFGKNLDGDGGISLYEYLAFVLKLYGAQPISGLEHIHGKKGRALVHVGAVDAPVTISEASAAIEECLRVKQSELHILGWEWEMGMYDLLPSDSKRKGVKVSFLQIPRELMEKQAADKGDIQFFELAWLEVEIKTPGKLHAAISLKEFVIPNTELIPEEVRSKIKKWSDYIDYWAVDWDFQNDTFMQGWVTYRTRQDRTLPLTSEPHAYLKAGKYTVMVKVIDIFGNDTTRAFQVEVSAS